MRRASLTLALIVAIASTQATAAPALRSAIVDPPRDAKFPAHNQQLLIPSHGVGMNALLFVASGKGPHRTVILTHGLPGNERNLDLAQAIRRAGWDVLTFTYRGAWGSPGDFSISNAMEDTRAALDFARSPEGAKYGIDGRHIVLAGHSMGGATAAMTASGAKGLDGLILIDAWNIAAGTSKGAISREELVNAFDDFGNSLHNATPESVADEVVAKRAQWDLRVAAQRLANLPILTVTAKYGGGEENQATTAALRKSGNKRVTAIEMDTDHPFSDHRIALESTVIRWLQALR
ncbi:MAG TPA: alpha/beta fold hydrolase [Sphingomicrobium sp.]|jgi:pimeloyl-ACP methyl ester carboxylesterase|nr:alpha/beta fold hydrolase [Sphingomicrobium sp.]